MAVFLALGMVLAAILLLSTKPPRLHTAHGKATQLGAGSSSPIPSGVDSAARHHAPAPSRPPAA